MRGLSESFHNDLLNGLLQPILERVKQDHTLMLAIRDGYINIYYRGGNLLKIEQADNAYQTFFDEEYNKVGKELPSLPKTIKNQNDVKGWVEAFPHLKEIMDLYFSDTKKKVEREFQQLVVRENNFSTISGETEYFITDIEYYVDSSRRTQGDMLAIRWLASQRKNGSNCRPALIEMKYGDKALKGDAGLVKHLQDIDSLITNKKRYSDLLSTMETQFNQLDGLELLNFNRSIKGIRIKLNTNDKPEVIIILANHNPRSSILNSILNDSKIDAYSRSPNFDLRFYVANFAGYGLHLDCMLTLTQFRRLLESRNAEIRCCT